jgi:hypothetical protein
MSRWEARHFLSLRANHFYYWGIQFLSTSFFEENVS